MVSFSQQLFEALSSGLSFKCPVSTSVLPGLRPRWREDKQDLGVPPTHCPSAWPWNLTPTPFSPHPSLLADRVNKDYIQTLSGSNAYWKKRGWKKILFSFSPPSKLMTNQHSQVQELWAIFLLSHPCSLPGLFFKVCPCKCLWTSSWFTSRRHLTLKAPEECVRCRPNG